MYLKEVTHDSMDKSFAYGGVQHNGYQKVTIGEYLNAASIKDDLTGKIYHTPIKQ